MIRFAVINRAKDGLALSASTDLDAGLDLKKVGEIIGEESKAVPHKMFHENGAV